MSDENFTLSNLNISETSWSIFMCSIIGVGERLHKVLGQIDLAYWTQVSDRCPLGYLLYDSVEEKVLLKADFFFFFFV